jgi:Flp pilus assembly protein TadG
MQYREKLPRRAARTLAPRQRSTRRAIRSGAATVELAVLAPLLVFLFVVTTDFARVFYYQITLNQCARNAALFGANLRSYQETTWTTPYSTASTPSDDNIKAVAVADGATVSPALTSSQVTVAHNNGTDGNAAVQVTITYPFQSITGIVGLINLNAKCSMRVAT